MSYPQTNLGCMETRAHLNGDEQDVGVSAHHHLRWLTRIPSWLCVAFGAFLGTAIRAGLDLAATGSGKLTVFSWSTVVVNLCGAFFLGFVTAWAQSYFREDTVFRKVMLVAGSGFAGALTTYATMVMASIHDAVQAMTAVPADGGDLSGAVSSQFSAVALYSLPLLIEGMLASLVLLVVGIGVAALGYSLTPNEESGPQGAKK